MSQFISNNSLFEFQPFDDTSSNHIQREVSMNEKKICHRQQQSVGLGLLVDKDTKQDQIKRVNSSPSITIMKSASSLNNNNNNNHALPPPKKINLPPPPTILFEGSSTSPKNIMFPFIKHIIPLPSPNYTDENKNNFISPFIPSSTSTATTTTVERQYSQMDLNSPTSSVSSSEEISFAPLSSSSSSSITKKDSNPFFDKTTNEVDEEEERLNIPIISLSPSIPSHQLRIPDLTELPILGDMDDHDHDEYYQQQQQEDEVKESIMINHLLTPTAHMNPSISSSPQTSSPLSTLTDNSTSSSSSSSFMIREQRSLLSPSLPTYDESTIIGKTIWKHKINRLLGVGAFSKVYLATNMDQPHRQFAIKMIGKSKLLKDLRMKSSIEREIAVLQFLHHPSIVQLQATMEIEKHICLLLEYVDGGELFDFVQQKCMMTSDDQVNEPLVQDLFLQLVTVVQWMHEQNVVHRDLKLENILLHYDQDGELKLKITDFGLARVIDPQQPILTTRCGSEEYTAPEIVQGIGYDGRLTDLWALGIILFAMLTGYLPFASRDGSSSSLFYQIMQAIVRWPKDIPISLQAKQVVQSILVRQPEKRKSLLSIQTLEWFQS